MRQVPKSEMTLPHSSKPAALRGKRCESKHHPQVLWKIAKSVRRFKRVQCEVEVQPAAQRAHAAIGAEFGCETIEADNKGLFHSPHVPADQLPFPASG